VNTQTYKYYVDFAAKYGVPYIILDEGWYKLGNVLDVVPEVNMEELSAYRQGEECPNHFVGDLEHFGRSAGKGSGSICEVGSGGDQG